MIRILYNLIIFASSFILYSYKEEFYLLAKTFLKRSMVLSLIISLLVMPITQIKKAEATSLVEKLLYGTVAVSLITSYYNNMNDHDQKGSLASTQKQTGVYDNKEAKQRIDEIQTRLKSSGLITANYAIYANPAKDLNAFCTLGHVISVNKGTLDSLDDDELGAIMAHEIGHGEKKHVVAGVTKGIGLGLAVDLFLENNQNNTSYILAGVGANYINNEMFTMEQEWEADNLSFDYMKATDFNPGGGAAAMVKIRSQYGELHHEGLKEVINPNNHPKTSDRIKNFSNKLVAYSNNHVTVKDDKTVLVNNQEILTPVTTSSYLAGERAYLIAGNLAKIYHNNIAGTAIVGDDGAIYIGTQKIVTLTEKDSSPDEVCNRINALR